LCNVINILKIKSITNFREGDNLKKIIFLVCCMFMSSTFARDHKLVVRLADGWLDWSSGGSEYKIKSTNDNVEIKNSSFVINMGVIFKNGFQLDGSIGSSVDEVTHSDTSEDSTKTESTSVSIGFLYNFNAADLGRTLYAGVYISSALSETVENNGAPTEVSLGGSAIVFGGRLGLDSIGLPNLYYSPRLSFGSLEWGKSAAGKITDADVATVELLALDYLF
jgi:hypothetical protein